MRTASRELQERIRRWSRVQNLAGGIAIVGIVLPFITAGIALLVQHITGDDGVFSGLAWAIFTGLVLLIVGSFLETEAERRVRDARFAGGHKSVGMVELVDEEPPSEIGGRDTFTLVISAARPGQATLRRRLYSQSYPSDARVQVGQIVIFRHTTADPDDMHDIQFVKFAGIRDVR